ncbi:TetR/AcrR family transcriptional regulator [Pseudomonas fluorescens]|uniref:TetR/AcrR family transcriptional regulator n=1 Tax=Pseudomonas fluorescens TaxID=294 RepID=UPI0019140B75|nr:TetR/AcrR family transcriptional regulator [Pseudomonas fluorescens]
MRSDAKQNYNHILIVARNVIAEVGVNASMRDIARKAEVGLATLFRHFPTREALLDTLLRTSLEELTDSAATLEASSASDVALVTWLREAVAFVRVYSGVVTLMATALSDPDSALHASCEDMRSAGTRLLERAQAEGMADKNMTGSDLFALVAALGWLGDQPAFASRADYFFEFISSAVVISHTERTI